MDDLILHPKPRGRKAMNAGADQLSAELLREWLSYDPATGKFRWIKRRLGCRKRQHAGYRDPSGYLTIRLLGRLYRANRLAWLYMVGEWPEFLVDHKDRDPSNNSWANLRPATSLENNQNKSKYKGSSKFKGVYFDADQNRWVAQIRSKGETRFLGRYPIEDDAARAYDRMAAIEFGEFAVLNLTDQVRP